MMKTKVFLTLFLFLLPSLWAEEGLASWYGGRFQGRKTANGEIFDTYKMTAAHKTLPFGTLVKVYNLNNGKSTVVRINDRGPFVPGRIIDLSKKAAMEISMLESGVAPVRLEIIQEADTESLKKAIQVGAYRDQANAIDQRDALVKAGLPVSLVKTEDGIIRVVIKEIEERELPAYEAKLRQLGYKDYLVKSGSPN